MKVAILAIIAAMAVFVVAFLRTRRWFAEAADEEAHRAGIERRAGESDGDLIRRARAQEGGDR